MHTSGLHPNHPATQPQLQHILCFKCHSVKSQEKWKRPNLVFLSPTLLVLPARNHGLPKAKSYGTFGGKKNCSLLNKQCFIPTPYNPLEDAHFSAMPSHIITYTGLTGWEKPKPFRPSVAGNVNNTPSCAILQVNSSEDCLRA